MKSVRRSLTTLLLLFLLSGCSATSGGSDSELCTNAFENGSAFVPRNIWAWRNSSNINDPTDIINNTNARSTFFTFAENHNVKTVYVSVRTMLERYSTLSPDTLTETNLPDFLNLASSRCMDVHFLIGNSGSYLSDSETASGYQTMTNLAINAKNYIQSLTGSKPAAVHWDVEPQALADWSTRKQEYVQRLVHAFQSTRAILKSADIDQAADIPHFWESADYSNTTCDPDNNTANPAHTGQYAYQCLIRVMDQIDIMDYRDQGTTSVNQAMTEITFASNNTNYAGSYTPVIVGQAVNSNADLTLTFYDEIRNPSQGTIAMEEQLQVIQNALDGYTGYGGKGLQSNYQSSVPTQSRYLFPKNRSAGISIHQYEAYSDASVIDNFM
jgi:hypothetical protein